MITKTIDSIPSTLKARIYMALIANVNARLVSFARMEYNALRRLGLTEPGEHNVDTANHDRVIHETRAMQLDPNDATTQARDTGVQHAANPRELAEPWVSLKVALMDRFDSFCRETGQTMPDQSLAGYLAWQKTMTFQPNQVAAKARHTASGGRISVETAVRQQRDEFTQDRQNLLNNGERILAIAENFAALETEGAEYDIDVVMSNLDEVAQLSIVNVLWRKLVSFWETVFASSRYRTTDLSGDMSLVTIAEQDCVATAAQIFGNPDVEEKYASRLTAGQSEIAVISALLKAKREAAAAGATATRPTPSDRVLVKKDQVQPGTLGEKLAEAASK